MRGRRGSNPSGRALRHRSRRAAVGGELLFTATVQTLGVASCGCSMDEWRPGTRAANMLPDSLLICGFVTAGYFTAGARPTDRPPARRTTGAAQLTRQTLESRLQAMQACIEPDSCSTRSRKSERRAHAIPSAARMLDDLIVYLRAALPHLRDTTSTVAKECELALAYLNIQRLRNPRVRRLASRSVPTRRREHAADGPAAADRPRACGDWRNARRTAALIGFESRRRQAAHSLAATGAAGLRDGRCATKLAGIRERLHALYGARRASSSARTIERESDHAEIAP